MLRLVLSYEKKIPHHYYNTAFNTGVLIIMRLLMRNFHL